jgi:hypothetical protein
MSISPTADILPTADTSPAYVFNGKKIDRKQFDELFRANETLVIANGGAAERGTLAVYLNEDQFVSALKGTSSADAVAKVREDVRKMLMDREKEKEEVLAARYKKENERVREEYLKLSKKTGLPHDSPELLQKAIDARIMNSAILFEHVNYAGGWMPVGKVPKLSWFGFNNKTSSFKMIFSVGFLADGEWYSGRKYWTFGTYFFEPNLVNSNFNDITSSTWL